MGLGVGRAATSRLCLLRGRGRASHRPCLLRGRGRDGGRGRARDGGRGRSRVRVRGRGRGSVPTSSSMPEKTNPTPNSYP